MANSSPRRPAARPFGRGVEPLAPLATGQMSAEVAGALFISVGTVKSHSANIYRNLEAKNRTEAVVRAGPGRITEGYGPNPRAIHPTMAS